MTPMLPSLNRQSCSMNRLSPGPSERSRRPFPHMRSSRHLRKNRRTRSLPIRRPLSSRTSDIGPVWRTTSKFSTPSSNSSPPRTLSRKSVSLGSSRSSLSTSLSEAVGRFRLRRPCDKRALDVQGGAWPDGDKNRGGQDESLRTPAVGERRTHGAQEHDPDR